MQLYSSTQLHGALTSLPLGPPESRERRTERPHDARGRQTDRPDDLHHQEPSGRLGRPAGKTDHRQDDADDQERDGEHKHASPSRLQRRPALGHLRQHRRSDATLTVDSRDGRP